MKAILALLLLASPAYGVTVAELQAQIDSIRADSIGAVAAVTKALVDSTVAADSLLAPGVNGVSVVTDAQDGEWVQIDLPLATSTGIAKSYWIGVISHLKDKYGAKDTGVAGRVRMSHVNAVKALVEMDANLKAGQ